MTMKFKGQGKINICGFEYKKKLQTAVGGGAEHPKTPWGCGSVTVGLW